MKTLSGLFIIIIISSCQPQQIDVEKDVKPTIRKNWDQFIESWESEDASACAAFYTENGINIPPSANENNGRSAIEEFYKFLFDNNQSSEYQHEILALSGNNEALVEYGKFQVEWTRNDSTIWTYYARTMTHWVNEEGNWRINKFIFNNPPEPSTN